MSAIKGTDDVRFDSLKNRTFGSYLFRSLLAASLRVGVGLLPDDGPLECSGWFALFHFAYVVPGRNLIRVSPDHTPTRQDPRNPTHIKDLQVRLLD